MALAKYDKIPIALIRQLLSYCPETGNLTWRPRTHEMVAGYGNRSGKRDNVNQWNTRWAGKPAFTSKNSGGYPIGTIFSLPFSAHRLAWALHYGYWPTEIDHINRVRDDYRIANLREVTRSENMNNTINQTRQCGVSWRKTKNRWIAYTGNRATRKHLGSFLTKEDAINARNAALQEKDM